LCITPSTNMINNIGFDSSATHVTNFIGNIFKRKKLYSEPISLPLKHPNYLMTNSMEDLAYEKSLDLHLYYALKDLIYHQLLNRR